jgi:hypothetical protein
MASFPRKPAARSCNAAPASSTGSPRRTNAATQAATDAAPAAPANRLKSTIAVRCGLWEVDRPGWLEADTVSHGGGGSSGEFMWSLTLTGIHTGWTELAGLWGGSGREVCVGLRRTAPD